MSSSSQSMNDVFPKSSVPSHPKLQEKDYILCKDTIGHGSFGLIRKATRKSKAVKDGSPSLIAVKIMLNYGDSSSKFMARELKTVPFKHDNIVRIYGEFIMSNNENGINLALAMELAHGDMDKWWDPMQHRAEDIVLTLGQVVRGLVFLHEKGIVHNDLKARNVLVVANTMKKGSRLSFLSHQPTDVTLKLCDFGAARNVNTAISGPNGTNHYIAPERRMEKLKCERNLYPKGDIFSCGIMALKMVTGKEGPETNNEQDLNKLVDANITDLRYSNFKDLILQMITWKPEDRLSAWQVLSVLTKGLFSTATEKKIVPEDKDKEWGMDF